MASVTMAAVMSTTDRLTTDLEFETAVFPLGREAVVSVFLREKQNRWQAMTHG